MRMRWMAGSTYLTTADDEHFLAFDLPGEDQTAAALDFRELIPRFTSHSVY